VTILFLKRDYRQAVIGLKGQFPAPSHIDQTIDFNSKLVAPDGSTIALLLCDVIPEASHKLAFRHWNTVDELPSNRSTAVGSLSLPRIKLDGTLGNRRGTPAHVQKVLARQGVAQGSIGYLDATPDQPCHRTPLTMNQSEMLDSHERLIQLVNKLYKQNLPAFYEKQRTEVEKVPRWRLWNTVFSTIYLAKNFRTAYHKDSGNLRGAMTALMPMGRYEGGDLVLPRWRIAFALRPGDLLFFDPQQLHGNLPFEGERLSAAYYCERRIAECGKLRRSLEAI
jgi:Oxygenase domain of the 2OGFeDO superfamily